MNTIKKIISKIGKKFNRAKSNRATYLNRFKKYSFNGTKCNSIYGYEAVITRIYHTIEKGLSFVDYKTGLSDVGANNLVNALSNYVKDGYPVNKDFYETALSVLEAYYEKEKEYGNDNLELLENIKALPGKANKLGGLIYFDKPVRTNDMNYESIVKNRHSIRSFSDEEVDIAVLRQAIELAQFTPSACNRQGWRTIVISDKKKIKEVLANQNGNAGFGQEINKLLLVVSDLRYFNAERETYQAFIDGGMYAENVINSLFYYGFGSIPLSASLTNDQENNVRSILQLNDAEVLILFIGVGHFRKKNQTTRSERKKIVVEVV